MNCAIYGSGQTSDTKIKYCVKELKTNGKAFKSYLERTRD